MPRLRKWLLIAAAVISMCVIVAAIVFASAPRQFVTDFTRSSLERAGLEKQVFEHDRGHITYFEGGEGPTLVFVHGLADQSGSWFRIAPKLEGYRILVVDLPRHGESPFKTDEDALTREVFEPLFELLSQEIGDEEATFIANSLGGWISMEFSLSHPEQVDRLILANSAGLSHDVDRSLLSPSDREEARRTVQTIFGDNTPPLPGFVLDAIVERAGESLATMAVEQMDEVEFLDDRFPEVTAPVHLVWGDQDLIFPMDYARQLDAALPNSRLHIIEGCGHSPQVGCPAEFLEIINEILANDLHDDGSSS